MRLSTSSSTSKTYGVAGVTVAWQMPRSTFYAISEANCWRGSANRSPSASSTVKDTATLGRGCVTAAYEPPSLGCYA
jgi:hypothetical protein